MCMLYIYPYKSFRLAKREQTLFNLLVHIKNMDSSLGCCRENCWKIQNNENWSVFESHLVFNQLLLLHIKNNIQSSESWLCGCYGTTRYKKSIQYNKKNSITFTN